MSDEQTQSTETSQPVIENTSQPVVENASTETIQPTSDEPAGYERVEFSPEQQKRFDRMYAQVKAQDRKFNDALGVMRQQSEVIERLQQTTGNVVNHLNAQNMTNSAESIRQEADAAFARGDSKSYLEAMRKVAELSAQKIVQQTIQQQQRQQQPVRQQMNSATDIANNAASRGGLDVSEVPVFEAWQDEKDGNGNLVRPWAKRETAGEGFDSAVMRSASVFADPKFRNSSIDQKLAEVDRIMGTQKQTPQQNVMGANLTTKGKTNNVKVSPDMEKVLNHLRPRGSKAKDSADPVAWYREQVSKANKQGARR